MLILAANVMQELRSIPRQHLINLGLLVLVIIVAVIVYQQAAKMNKLVLFLLVAITLSVVGLTWVYQRTEPKFLTPLIDEIAPFFPQAPTSHW